MPLCLSLAPTLRPVARESSLPWWRTSEEQHHETDIHPSIYMPCRHIHSRCCKKKVNWILRVGNLDSDFILRSPKRSGRQSGRTTVISCRVFRKGVCKKTTRNIILVNKSISSSHKCQQFCYATPGCAAFTHFEQSKKEDRKCVLFRDCNGKLSSCSNCIRFDISPLSFT